MTNPDWHSMQKKAKRRGLTVARDFRNTAKPYTVLKIGESINSAVRCATDLDLHVEILKHPCIR